MGFICISVVLKISIQYIYNEYSVRIVSHIYFRTTKSAYNPHIFNVQIDTNKYIYMDAERERTTYVMQMVVVVNLLTYLYTLRLKE